MKFFIRKAMYSRKKGVYRPLVPAFLFRCTRPIVIPTRQPAKDPEITIFAVLPKQIQEQCDKGSTTRRCYIITRSASMVIQKTQDGASAWHQTSTIQSNPPSDQEQPTRRISASPKQSDHFMPHALSRLSMSDKV